MEGKPRPRDYLSHGLILCLYRLCRHQNGISFTFITLWKNNNIIMKYRDCMLDVLWRKTSSCVKEEVSWSCLETRRWILRHRCKNWRHCLQCLYRYSSCPRRHQREGNQVQNLCPVYVSKQSVIVHLGRVRDSKTELTCAWYYHSIFSAGWELHTLLVNVFGGACGWVCVSMEASFVECGGDSRNRIRRRFIRLHSHRHHFQEPWVLRKRRCYSRAGDKDLFFIICFTLFLGLLVVLDPSNDYVSLPCLSIQQGLKQWFHVIINL